MADLGNLKILLDMATTGNLKSTLENVDKRLDKMREKAASLQLGFDDKSVSALSTKMRDIADSMQEVSRNAGTKLAEGMAKSAEATKSTTTQMQQQVALSADLEALFKEMAGTLRAIADSQVQITSAKGASRAATQAEVKEEQTLYDITRLRQIAEQKKGQLTQDQISVLKQMEAIEKALVSIDEKHSTTLAKDLQTWMHYNGVTKEQLGTYQAIITRMQAAQKIEEKATREAEKASAAQKRAAREREAAAKRQSQLETTILRIETRLLGMDEARLQASTRLMVEKMRTGQITQEEANKLMAILAHEQAIIKAERQKGAAAQQTNQQLTRQSALLSQIKSYLGMYFSVLGAVGLVKNLVRITGEFEAQHVALRAILQDVAGADRIFYQLQELAVKSPFTFRNLTDYAKQLSAFSVPMNEIYDTTKRLADVSAGLGVDMSRIILAFGQIRSASFLRGQEVRQLTEAGIPVLQELSKQFKEIEGEAVSVGKVFDKISARQVPFEMIEKMFKDLTSEGGKFYQMQETLAETVKGKVSNLQDAWEIMLSKVGEDNSGFIKGVLDGVTSLIKNYKELAKAIELAAVAYGTYRAAAMAATQAESMQRIIHLATGKNVSAIPALLTKIGIGLKNIPGSIAGIVSKLNPWAIGIAAVTTAVAALIMRHREMNAHIRETYKITREAIAKAEASKSNIHYYIQEMKRAKEGTEEYNKARQAVISQSGTYISATDAERLSLQNVDDVWVNICKHIEEATKLQAMQSVVAKAEADKQEKQLDIMDKWAKYQQSNDLSREEFNFGAAYIRGDKSYEELYNSRLAQKGRAFQFLAGLREDFDEIERKYQETIRHGEKTLSGLYGSGKAPAPVAPEPLTGWRLRAQQYLDTFNGKTRGVKITEETNLADLAESGAKSLNELRKALELIPNTEADYKAVENDITFWEKLSEAIYGSGNTEFNNSTKLTKKQLKDAEALRKEQIAAIKQSVQDLKEAKRWYDQLTPLLGSDNAKTLLASFNFAVPKEGFGAAFQGYSDKLKALGDKNGARDVMNWANGREVGDVLAAAKAVEKYTEALKDFEAQTKRLNLSGFAQELDKIIVDADSKNRQLETNWAQKAEELEKAKDGWIQRYRVENEKATADDAEKAWKAFYDNQVAMAKKSIDTQREYNNKVAQEQINDKASKWVEEMMKEGNIDLSNMSDKSIGQMNVLIERMRTLVSNGALSNLIPAELKNDAALLNVSFSELLSNIEKIVNTKIGDVQVERMKKILGGLSSGLSTLGLSADMGAVQDAYAKYVEKMREEEQAQNELNKAQIDAAVNRKNQAEYMEKAVAASEKLKEAQTATGESLKELKWSAALVGVQAFASALDNLGASIAKIGDAKGDESLKGLGDAISSASKALENAAGAAIAGFLIGGPAGAAIGAGLSMLASAISSVLDAVAEAEAYTRKMAAESDRWALAVSRVRNEYALLQEQFDTIFGESNISKMAGWMNLISEQSKILREFNGGGVADYASSLVNKGDLSVSDIENLIAKMKNTTNELANTNIKVVDRIFGVWDEYKTIAELAPQLFNEDGSLNFDYLDEFKNTEWYNQLSDEWKRTLDKMEEANETYMDAVGKMNDYLTSVFGEVGATITEQMISKFEETGEVAMDTGDILSNVAKKFVSDWTQAFLMKNYLSGLGDSINKIWMDSTLDMDEQISQSLGMLRDSLTAMSDRLPQIQAFYEGMEDQFHWADGAGEELGDAIKTAMVEQNSSLIAGYLNSIRADVTMNRNEILRNISPSVTSISNGFNTHLQYMESVAGNVANIWNRLNLLTSSGSGVKINARM